MKQSSLARRAAAVGLGILLALGQACTWSLGDWNPFDGNPTGGTSAPVTPTYTPMPAAQVTFTAVLQQALLPGETLALSLLDELTGLALNQTIYPMQAVDPLTYSVDLPLQVNAVVKYRYLRRSTIQVQEDTADSLPMRYRLFYVTGPGEVRDIVSGWVDRPFSGAAGSIEGEVYDASTGAPLVNILVTAGGIQSITDSAGRFDLEGLPPGTHNLVAYAMDGAYRTFQQGAVVASGMNTPVDIALQLAPMVPVTFSVTVPRNTVSNVPVRLAGNLLQLGNTFADLRGGMSNLADRMPVMTPLADGSSRYTLTINLPAGADVQYKYTLGDGFWNAEHRSNGDFVVRRLIIPQENVIIQDVVETWQAGPSAPILFQVTVPPSTPVGDIIYIQFNPYGWTEPVPMWPLGDNRWAYKLYGPFNVLSSFGYRYCRNGQCGSADDVVTAGDATRGRPVSTSLTPQDILDTVSGWIWMQTEPGEVVAAGVKARSSGFIAGVEMQADFHPGWPTFMPQALQNVQALGANWVVLTPTWTYSGANPLVFAPQPGQNILWNDSYRAVTQARALNLNVAIFPLPRFPASADDWWIAAPRDALWWQTWFDHYRAFAVHHADLASKSGAQALILGGEWLAPALPGGALADGSPSNQPTDIEARWSRVLSEVRQHFNGALLWALPYSEANVQTPVSFLKETDGVYLLLSASLSDQPNPSSADLLAAAGALLDNGVAPLQSLIGKPVILAVGYPSAAGAASGCISDGGSGCLALSDLSRPNPDIPSLGLDLEIQADIYEAMLSAVNERPWVSGVVSRGYYPPVALQDKSASVHGKPAADVLWYWFPRMLGLTQ